MNPAPTKGDSQRSAGKGQPLAAFIAGQLFLLSAMITRGGLHDQVFEPGLLVWLVLGCVATHYALRVWRPWPLPWPGIRVLVSRTGVLLTVLGWVGGLIVVLGPPHDPHALDQRLQGWCRGHICTLASLIERYADDHNGHYPDRLDALLGEGWDNMEIFVCQSTRHTPAPGATPAEGADALANGGHLSYIYVGRGQTKATTRPDTVMLYEPETHHTRDHPGLHVAYAGEHVEYLQDEAARNFMLARWHADHP